MLDIQEKTNSEDTESWASGIVVHGMKRYHPYTRKDFVFDHEKGKDRKENSPSSSKSS